MDISNNFETTTKHENKISITTHGGGTTTFDSNVEKIDPRREWTVETWNSLGWIQFPCIIMGSTRMYMAVHAILSVFLEFGKG